MATETEMHLNETPIQFEAVTMWRLVGVDTLSNVSGFLRNDVGGRK